MRKDETGGNACGQCGMKNNPKSPFMRRVCAQLKTTLPPLAVPRYSHRNLKTCHLNWQVIIDQYNPYYHHEIYIKK